MSSVCTFRLSITRSSQCTYCTVNLLAASAAVRNRCPMTIVRVNALARVALALPKSHRTRRVNSITTMFVALCIGWPFEAGGSVHWHHEEWACLVAGASIRGPPRFQSVHSTNTKLSIRRQCLLNLNCRCQFGFGSSLRQMHQRIRRRGQLAIRQAQ